MEVEPRPSSYIIPPWPDSLLNLGSLQKEPSLAPNILPIDFSNNKNAMRNNVNIRKEAINILNNNKALEITSINLKNKTSIADFMIIASGNSSRHIQAISEILLDKLKIIGVRNCRLEGRRSNDWKLIDAVDIIIHIFHPEKRKFYDLERMWSELIPKERLMI